MRVPLVLACLLAAVNVSAQGTAAPAKPDAKAASTKAPPPNAKAANPKLPAKPDSTKVPPPKAAGTTGDVKQATKAAAPVAATKQPARPPAPQATPAPVVTPVIMREAFAYNTESRRDPFVSLLTSAELRPTVGDLRLTGILYDESGRNSVATMRDMTSDIMYRVRAGQILGRMRVALIKRSVVIFSIEEFGLNRQDSLVLGDTTKARAK
jgi:hypothetical protein